MARPALGVLLEYGDVVDGFEGGETPMEAGILGQVTQPTPDLQPIRRVERVAPEQPHAAGVRGEDRGEDPQQCRLSGTVRSE